MVKEAARLCIERGAVKRCGINQAIPCLYSCPAGRCGWLGESAVGQVFEMRVPADALSQVSDSLLVSRVTQQGMQAHLRVVGRPPQPEAQPVAPSLEDDYLLLARGAEREIREDKYR
jgi:hypothetical protein